MLYIRIGFATWRRRCVSQERCQLRRQRSHGVGLCVPANNRERGNKKKGGPFPGRLIRSLGYGANRFTFDLRNVIAQRGEDHVVDSLWRDRGPTGCHASGSGPSRLGYVGVLHAELKAAFRSLVELVPEAESAFLDKADVSGAIGAGRRVEVVQRHAFGRAAAIVGCNVSVTANRVKREGGGSGGRNRGAGGSSRNCRSLDHGDAVIAFITGAPGVFSAVIAINVDFGSRMPFDPCQPVAGSNQRKRTVRTRGGIRE